MAKSARAFQLNAEDVEEALSPPQASATSKPPDAAPQPTQAALAVSGRPAYRQDRRNLSVWLDAKAFNTFKAMVAEEGVTVQDYVIDMINREFARKGRPQIAKK